MSANCADHARQNARNTSIVASTFAFLYFVASFTNVDPSTSVGGYKEIVMLVSMFLALTCSAVALNSHNIQTGGDTDPKRAAVVGLIAGSCFIVYPFMAAMEDQMKKLNIHKKLFWMVSFMAFAAGVLAAISAKEDEGDEDE